MTESDDRHREELFEQVCGAWRPRDADGAVQGHPAWFDLAPPDRTEAFRETARLRRMEAALDPRGLSTTARVVLARVLRLSEE